MKVLCDVHISYRVVSFLNGNGIEAIHVNNILDGTTTKDSAICAFADEESFAVLTKDADFRDTHLLKQTPKQLIKFNLGNVATNEMIEILQNHLSAIINLGNIEKFMLEIESNGLRVTQL